MSREKETSKDPWDRTKEDYIQICRDGQKNSFGDYDNSEAFFGLVKDGILEIDPTKPQSVWTSMSQSVWLREKMK